MHLCHFYLHYIQIQARILYNINRHATELCRLDCIESREIYPLGKMHVEYRMLLSADGTAEVVDKKLMRSHMTVGKAFKILQRTLRHFPEKV